MDLTVGAGSVTSDIVTDGTIGGLAQSDFVDWNLLLDNGPKTFDLLGPLSGNNSGFFDHAGAGDLSASATQVLFNFSGSGLNDFVFVSDNQSNRTFVLRQAAADHS